MAENTILDVYKRDVARDAPGKYTLYTPEGNTTWSNAEFAAQVYALADGFTKLGLDPGDRVCLVSDNRPEWAQLDLAITDAGYVMTPFYGNLMPDLVAYQINDCGAKVAITDTAEQMAKFLQVKDQCPTLETLIQIDGTPAEGVKMLSELIDDTDPAANEKSFWERAENIKADDLLTIIYTSGTTGDPKGVMLTHKNLVENMKGSMPLVAIDPAVDHGLEFLPMCHSLERNVSYIYMYHATKRSYCSVYHIAELLPQIQPTLFAGVPRFFEKVHDKAMANINSSGAVSKAIATWALEKGRKAAYDRMAGRPVGGFAHNLADKLVFSKVRAKMGGRVTRCVSGGAALPMHVGEFFHSIGVMIVEGYGLTETSPVIAVNGTGPGECRLGTVGRPIANVEIKIAEDGELLCKGPNVMPGYWNKPEETKDTFTDDGWFCTGDIAEIDDDGFVLITDRKKAIIVTGGGKNVAPQPIENQLKESRWIEMAALIGDERRYIVALVGPNWEELGPWAKAKGLDTSDRDAFAKMPEVLALFEPEIERANTKLARFEQIKKFRLLPRPLSVEEGHLTPTLKIKRKKIGEDFSSLIEEMYS